ncbi:MAG: ATP-binding cassette domain-containing protein [Spirochaetia bacterium]|nr:ATP-binding cassette domain-containing protein [Spirochaetia bacterium]
MALFSIEGLRFSYTAEYRGKKAPAVLEIDRLEINAGKIYVLLGSNGSGKTTLLKLMNRLLLPTKGSICFQDEDILTGSTLRQRTVYVHQNPLLFSGTVYSNVAYGLKLRKFSHREVQQRVHRTLKVVGLQGFERKRSSALSGGEAQRVAIARALAVEPEVLLLDEPTSSIDKDSIGKLEQLLAAIQRDYGCTIIISSHNLPFAYRMGDTLIKLEDGRLVPTGQNILKGHMSSAKAGNRIFQVCEPPGGPPGRPAIFCPDIDGHFTTAVIDYDRILLSDEPLHSSAQNCFKGTVYSFTAYDGPEQSSWNSPGLVDVTLDVEGRLITSRITRKSLEELALSPGDKVYLSFKASSIRLY